MGLMGVLEMWPRRERQRGHLELSRCGGSLPESWVLLPVMTLLNFGFKRETIIMSLRGVRGLPVLSHQIDIH